MTQSFWYLRHEGQIFGPYPEPQIEEALRSGEVSPQWEISLNEADWVRIEESDLFKVVAATASKSVGEAEESLAWRDQQLEARKKWLQEGAAVTETVHDPEQDAATRNSVARDHIRTHELLQAEKSKPTSPWIALLVLVLVSALGMTIWFGQRDKPIQASLSKITNCAAVLADGVNWTGCNKRAFSQAGIRARNAQLDKIQLEDAHLKGADLAYASLKNASLRNAELTGINFSGADLTGADLSGADLSGTDLSYAVLASANLTGVRLDNAKLDKASWIDGRVCAEGSLGECR